MPSTATDRLNGLTTSIAVKPPCRVATTANITLSGLQTINGVALAEDDRVLVKDQTTQSQNGIYLASTSDWTRAKDFDGNRDVVQGTRVLVAMPNSAHAAEYEVTTANPITIDTTSITFVLRYGANATYDRTAAEITAEVTPVDYSVPHHLASGGFAFINRYAANTVPGTTVMTTAIRNAIAVAQAAKCNVGGYPEVYAVNDKISITAVNDGITICGVPFGGMMQGSVERNLTFAYVGSDAEPMFEVTGTYVQWRDVNFQNRGTATYAVVNIPGGRNSFYRCSANIYNATLTRFANGVIRYEGGANYDVIEDCEFQSGAPVVVDYDGLSNPSVGTSLFFVGGVYDSVSTYDMTILKCTNGAPEMCGFERITFNSQATSKVIAADYTNVGIYETDNLNVHRCEFDSDGQLSTWNLLKLKNVKNADVDMCTFYGAGIQTTLIDLVNSYLHLGKNVFRSVSGPIVSADSDSRVFYKPNHCPVNVEIVDNSTTTTGIVNVTYGTTCNILGYKGDPGGLTTYYIDVTNNSNFDINAPLPGESTPGYFVRGQHVIVTIRNKSGGAMGTATFNTSYFKTSGAVTAPADTKSRSFSFVFSGTHLIEQFRSAADVPND